MENVANDGQGKNLGEGNERGGIPSSLNDCRRGEGKTKKDSTSQNAKTTTKKTNKTPSAI